MKWASSRGGYGSSTLAEFAGLHGRWLGTVSIIHRIELSITRYFLLGDLFPYFCVLRLPGVEEEEGKGVRKGKLRGVISLLLFYFRFTSMRLIFSGSGLTGEIQVVSERLRMVLYA